VLHEGLLGSPLSLTEGRVIWELAQRERATASELAGELDLDAGYLSRILGGFERRGLIKDGLSESDGRQSNITLTQDGGALYATIDARSRDYVTEPVGRLGAADQAQLVAALETAERLLAPGRKKPARASYVLRPHQAGDMGWIVYRHGALYAREFSFDQSFEVLFAQIAAALLEKFDAACERCWIADHEGVIAGSVLLVKESEEEAKLRVLQVASPICRAVGSRSRHRPAGCRVHPLCVRAALRQREPVDQRRAGLRPPYLRGGGFPPCPEEPHHSFGRDLVGQVWELPLP
jgi:DNA-binding MarR family transcriptional regulator